MAEQNADVIIIGGGIAGLWTLARLRALGYDALLVERQALGAGQTIAAQGIIHSGLKYALAGKKRETTQNLSSMPRRWLSCIEGRGEINLTGASVNADAQFMLLPGGFRGFLIRQITKKAFHSHVKIIRKNEWPADLSRSGFRGSILRLEEPVLDISGLLKTFLTHHEPHIRYLNSDDPVQSLHAQGITARHYIFTAGAGNFALAKTSHHNLRIQKRPLLMGMIRDAPFPLYAHLVGFSSKPVMTVTTHIADDGKLIWYLGGAVAEHPLQTDPEKIHKAALQAFKQYLPHLNVKDLDWDVFPVERIEAETASGALPGQPSVDIVGDHIYAFPTKLAFAPLLADQIIKRLHEADIFPSQKISDWRGLPGVEIAAPPWDKGTWKKERSARQD